MSLTHDPAINPLLNTITTQLQAHLGEKLLGVYVYGSLTTGDFDEASDIDLLAVLEDMLTDDEFDALDKLHQKIVADAPRWTDRIEIIYATQTGIHNWDTKVSQQAVISPGEPFHIVEAGRDWVSNWYLARVYGQTLYGEPPESTLPAIPKTDFLQAVKQIGLYWTHDLTKVQDLQWQSYVILTMCRAYYTLVHGEHVSKKRAQAWAQTQFPDHAALIEQAWQGRSLVWADDVEHDALFPQTKQIIASIAAKIKNIDPS